MLVSMNQASYAEGDLVKITRGTYKDMVGVVDDIKPECSVIRIHAKDGPMYADADAVERMGPPPKKELKPLNRKR